MPGYLPLVNGGSSAIYPVSRNITYNNRITQFINGSEQRAKERPALGTFVLKYSNISRGDRNLLDAFVAQQNQYYSPTWTFQFLQPPFPPNCSFTDALNGWVSQNDTGWVTAWLPNLGIANDGCAQVHTTTATIATAATIYGRIIASPVPTAQGQPVSLSYWVNIAKNLPANATVGGYCLINVYNAQGALLGQIDPGVRTVGITNWQQVTLNFTVGFAGAASFRLILLGYVANGTGAALRINTSSAAVAFDTVIVTQTGEPYVYPSCVFEDNEITWTNNRETPGAFNGQIRFRQSGSGGMVAGVYNGGWVGPGPGGALTGFPFVASDEYYTAQNDLPSGPRFTYPFYGGQLSGFPSRALKKWSLGMSTLTDAQLAALEAVYVGCGGTWRGFAFLDPVTFKTYQTCRFGSDTLEITHLGPNLSSCNVQLVEYYNKTQWVA